MSDRRRPRAKYDDYIDYRNERPRGRIGLNQDYYDGHPLDPRRHPRRDDYHDDAYDRPPKSKMDQALVRIQDGDFRGALQQVVKPRSQSAVAPRSRSGTYHSSSTHHRYRDDSSSSPERHGRRRHHDDDYDDRQRARSSRSSHAHSSHHRHSSHAHSSRRRSSSEGKWQQAAGAALVAGAVEAMRMHNEPGKWSGGRGKGARVATAAIAAAGIDAGIDRHPEKHAKRHVAESALGGLLVNRLANGSKDDRHSRRR